MNKRIIAFIIAMIFLLYTGSVSALSYGRVTNVTTTSRTGPGTNYTKSSVLNYNDVIQIYNTAPLKSTGGCAAGWYKASANGKTVYVCRTDISGSNITAKVSSDTVNIRTGAGTDKEIYAEVPKNTLLTIASVAKVDGAGCDGGWYRLSYKGSTARYVCSDNMKEYNTKTNLIVANKDGVNLRAKANSSSDKIVSLKYGQALTISGLSLVKGSGCSDGWYKVLYNNKTSYVCSSYVVKPSAVYRVNYTTGLKVRKSKSSSSTLITTLSYNQPVILKSTTKYTGTGCTSGWYKVNINEGYGYVCSKYTSNTGNSISLVTDATIRAKASTNSDKIIKLKVKNPVLLQSTTKVKGESCSSDWYKIKINGKTGYVCSIRTELGKSLSTNTNTSSSTSSSSSTSTSTSTSSGPTITSHATNSGKYYTINKWTYRINEDYAYARSSASTSSTIKDVLYLGTELTYVASVKATDGCSSGWYKVKYYNDKIGYVCKIYVDKYSAVTKSDSTYCDKLKEAGFPASYCPYLSYLHSKHPKWKFKAEKTNVKFLSAINGESKRNYTQITKTPYLVSTTVSEAGGWRTASDAYVAFMIDPRNYLNEKNIFAFESLSYDEENHTKDMVRAVVSGTYLDTDTYAGYFIEAAKKYNVSPVHLAARVKQEGGSNKSYAAVSGTVTTTWSVTSSGYICGSTAYGEANDSYFVFKDGKTGYVRSGPDASFKLLKYSNGNTMIADSNDTVKLVHKYKFNAYTTEEVNLREKASTSSATVSSLGSKLPLSLVSTEKYEGAGCSEGWYKVKTGSATGYVCSSYVNTEITCPTGWYKIILYKSL